jgi:hypothetical protein
LQQPQQPIGPPQHTRPQFPNRPHGPPFNR